MIGLLTYLPTLAFIPHMSYLLILIYLLFKYGKNLKIGNISNLLIILLIISLSIANNLLHPHLFEQLSDYIPFLILMFISLISANHFTARDSKILVYLIAFESVIVILEAAAGVSTFFTSIPGYRVLTNSSLLYQNRPYGLSSNSSVIALKILVAFVLILYHKFKGKSISIAILFLALGCLLTFNRTVIFSLAVFFSLYYLIYLNTIKLSKGNILILGSLLLCSSIALIFYYYEIIDVVFSQLSRNKGKIGLTGRDKIWELFLDFIVQNFQLGNGSFKYNVTLSPTHTAHGHNSFLQVLATHGFYIFLLYLILIIKNINKHNFIFVFAFVFFSLAQYGIFWGVSLMDIVFFKILFDQNINKINNFEPLNTVEL